MQQIERYGIIALLFLVVSIVVVALWDPDPGTTLGNNNTRTAAAEKGVPRELPLAQPASNQASNRNRNKATRALTEPKSRQAQGNKRPVATHSPSAPLDLGAQNRGRNRGRNNGAAAKPKSEFLSAPVASETKLISPGPSRLTREQTQPNAGSVRSTGRLTQAQGGGTMLASSTKRIANPRAIAASFNKQGSPASKPLASGKKYTVKAGDSLERIARSQLGSGQQWKNLAALNGITNPNMVRIGDVLALPVAVAGSSAKAAPRTPKASSGKTSAAGTYTVAKGDVLSRIAERRLGSSKRWREIVALNPGLDPARLMVGKVLNMPGGAKSSPVAIPTEATYLASAGRSKTKPARFVVE